MSAKRTVKHIAKHSCLDKTIVRDMRRREGYIYRRRECRICGKRYSTKEVDYEAVLTEDEQNDHKELLLNFFHKFEMEWAKIKQKIGDF